MRQQLLNCYPPNRGKWQYSGCSFFFLFIFLLFPTSCLTILLWTRIGNFCQMSAASVWFLPARDWPSILAHTAIKNTRLVLKLHIFFWVLEAKNPWSGLAPEGHLLSVSSHGAGGRKEEQANTLVALPIRTLMPPLWPHPYDFKGS